MKNKNIVVLGDERVVHDYNLFDVVFNKKISVPNYLINRILFHSLSEIKSKHIDYNFFDEQKNKLNPETDIILIHADQTFRDDKLVNIINDLCTDFEVWNSHINDISKTNVDEIGEKIGLERLIINDRKYNGFVFLKTNNNAGDSPKDLEKFQYKLMHSSEVPAQLWEDNGIVIQKYIDGSASKYKDYARIDRVLFLNNEHVIITRYGRDKSKIKVNDTISFYSKEVSNLSKYLRFLNSKKQFNVPYSINLDLIQKTALTKTKEIQKKLNMNFGSVEFMKDYESNKIYLIDINHTSFSRKVDETYISIFYEELKNNLKR